MVLIYLVGIMGVSQLIANVITKRVIVKHSSLCTLQLNCSFFVYCIILHSLSLNCFILLLNNIITIVCKNNLLFFKQFHCLAKTLEYKQHNKIIMYFVKYFALQNEIFKLIIRVLEI